jgi:thiamine biosynthesis lipoprotein
LGRANAPDGWLIREEAIMGTAVRVELKRDDRAAAEAAATAVMAEMHRIDRVMSPFKPESELSAINRDAAARPVAVSRELFDLIRRSIEFSELSGGAFDVTFSSVGHLYDYRAHVRPTEEAIARALPAVGYRHLRLDGKALTVGFARAGVHVDLGGIAKGLAVDNGIALLRARGIREALVSAGGDSRVLGAKDGRPWIIGIRDPRNSAGMVAKIPLVDAAISTSGDYERYFEENGTRHHHVIDPRTGKAAPGVRSVTIIGPDAVTTEGMSKPVFIKGVREGLRFVESLAGIDAVIVDDTGALHYSRGLQAGAGT